MSKIEFIQTIRQLIADGKTDEALSQMRAQVNQFDPSLVTDATLLESRYTTVSNDFTIKNILSRQDYDRNLAQINYALLEILEKLEKTALLPTVSGSAISTSTAKNKNSGRILHNIPGIMPVEKERRCIVRIAYDDETLLRDLKVDENITIQNVRITEVMGVELVDFNETPAFSIRTITEEEQFISADDYTQWLFMVKALREGKYPLTLKVAVIEEVNGKERTRNIVLEKEVFVISQLEEPPTAAIPSPITTQTILEQPSATHFEDTAIRFNYTTNEEKGAAVTVSKRFSMSGVMSMFGVIIMAMGGWVTFQTFSNKTNEHDIVTSLPPNEQNGSHSGNHGAGTTDTLHQIPKTEKPQTDQFAQNEGSKERQAVPNVVPPKKDSAALPLPMPKGTGKVDAQKVPIPPSKTPEKPFKTVTKPAKPIKTVKIAKKPATKPKPIINASEANSTTAESANTNGDVTSTSNTPTNVTEKEAPVKTFKVRLILRGEMKKAEISIDGQSVDKYLKKNFWGTPQYIEFKSSKERHTITFKRGNISCSITDVLIENGDMTVEPCSFD
jgi:Effector-associated domain 11